MLKLTKTLAGYAGTLSIACIVIGSIVLLTGNPAGLAAMAVGLVSMLVAGSVLLLASIDAKLETLLKEQTH